MTDHEIQLITDRIEAVVNTHVSYLREDIGNLRRELGNIVDGGCPFGRANRTRIDAWEQRMVAKSAQAGAGSGGAIAAVIVGVVEALKWLIWGRS